MALNFDLSLLIFMGSALSTALLGGWHCGGMCGPLAALASNKKAAFLYQTGRMISYVSLGFLAGLGGEKVFGWLPPEKNVLFSILVAALSFWILISSWHLQFFANLQRFIWRNRPRRFFSFEYLGLGFLNGLLPCTWLYGFVTVAAGLQNPGRGAVLLFCLWLGSTPWLFGFSFLGNKIRALRHQSQWSWALMAFAIIIGLIAQSTAHIHLH